jgi:alpha-1,3-glucosyltransferase|tara:strand:- start:656 stop:1480 length:825 start_codon:yes stop_codon:yes gene_type:complete
MSVVRILAAIPADEATVAAVVLLLALLVRACVGLHGYSGEGQPPMYGDFEAQRHWMEVTLNLPTRSWYVESKTNELQYWGLDYPPLSAYLSYAIGSLAARVHPKLIALVSSRGYESLPTRHFMRTSVVVCDVLVWLPAAFFATRYGIRSTAERYRLLLLLTLLPPLILIDHGHFQVISNPDLNPDLARPHFSGRSRQARSFSPADLVKPHLFAISSPYLRHILPISVPHNCPPFLPHDLSSTTASLLASRSGRWCWRSAAGRAHPPSRSSAHST